MLDALRFVGCFLLRETWEHIQHLQNNEMMDHFTAKSNSQAFYYRPLSIAFGEALFLKRMVDSQGLKAELRLVLQDLASLFGTFRLEKHFPILIRGGYFHKDSSVALHEAIEILCERLYEPRSLSNSFLR